MVFGIGGGGGGDIEVNQDPWGPTQGYAKDIMSEAERLYQGGGPEYYPYSTVAPLSPYSRMALRGTAQRAMYGSPLVDAAQGSIYDIAAGGYFGGGPSGNLFNYAAQGGFVNPTLGLLNEAASGELLNANPYIDAAYGNAAEAIRDQYEQATTGTNDYFSLAGRSGSGAFAEARNDLDENLAEQLGDLSQDYYYRNYMNERGRQLQAQGLLGNFYNLDVDRQLGAGRTMEDLYGRDIGLMMGAAEMAPGLANQDYYDLEKLASAGAVRDMQNQRQIDDAVARWGYYQTGPGSEYGQLDRYMDYIYPWASQGGTRTQSGGGGSEWTQMLSAVPAIAGLLMSNPTTAATTTATGGMGNMGGKMAMWT